MFYYEIIKPLIIDIQAQAIIELVEKKDKSISKEF